MPKLLSEKTITARKRHVCRTCFQTAAGHGEQYTRQTYVHDGIVYAWIQCAGCAAAASYVLDWCADTDDGIGEDEYVDWAMDVGWASDMHPSQQTDEQKAALAFLARRRKIVIDHSWIGVAGHPDDPDCTHRPDETDLTYCGRREDEHLWSSR